MPFAGIFPFFVLPDPGAPAGASRDSFPVLRMTHCQEKISVCAVAFPDSELYPAFFVFFARISAGPRPGAVDAGPVGDRLTAPFQNRGRRERWSVPSRRPAGMSGRNRPDGERKEYSSGRHCAWPAGHDRHIRPAFQILDRRQNFMIALLPPSPRLPGDCPAVLPVRKARDSSA